jgi:hypothetical protein
LLQFIKAVQPAASDGGQNEEFHDIRLCVLHTYMVITILKFNVNRFCVFFLSGPLKEASEGYLHLGVHKGYQSLNTLVYMCL